jgi:hypothetical protein
MHGSRDLLGSVGVLGLLALPGCNQPAYFEGFERLVLDAATIEAAAAEDSATAGPPQIGAYVQTEYWLDYAPPTAAELEELQPEGAEPADVTPWVRREDLELAVAWTVTNESEAPVRAWVALDGATEFFDWNPVAMYGIGGGEDAEELPLPSLLGNFPRMLEAGEVLHGEFREDDLLEATYDLDVLTRFCGGPFAVLNNRSEKDPRGTEAVPPEAVIAGPVMLRLTLGGDGPLSLEYSIRVRDRARVLFDARRDETRYETMPEPYVPAGVAMVPAGEDDPSTMSAFCGTNAPADGGTGG